MAYLSDKMTIWIFSTEQDESFSFCTFSTCTTAGLLSQSHSSRHHSSSTGVKVKGLFTWPPRIIDCGITQCDCVRMHVTLLLHSTGSAGMVWKHLQFKGPLGARLYTAGFISFLFWMEQEAHCKLLYREKLKEMQFALSNMIVMNDCLYCIKWSDWFYM